MNRKRKAPDKSEAYLSDLAGNRTRAFAVRGRRLSRLTTRPYRGDKIRTCGLCVPNAALYQTEPHLESVSRTHVVVYTIGLDLSTSFSKFFYKFFSSYFQALISMRKYLILSHFQHIVLPFFIPKII